MLRAHCRLIARHQNRCVYLFSHRRDTRPDRRRHPLAPILIHNNPRTPQRAARQHVSSRRPQNHNHRIAARLRRNPNRTLQQRLPCQNDQLLRFAQPPGRSRSQDDRRNPAHPAFSAHCVCRYRDAPPFSICRATSSGLNLRELPSRPWHHRCTSATIASAIASGPSPPRSSPTGANRRSQHASTLRPSIAAASLTSRLLRCRDPAAPGTAAASGSTATSSARSCS